jgi:hypothetical protein
VDAGLGIFGEAEQQRRLPWVTVMGGGYGRVVDDTVDVYEATVAAAVAALAPAR